MGGYGPDMLHGTLNHGALRRACRNGVPSVADPRGARVLTWPLLFLNLFCTDAVTARASYWIEPGRGIVSHSQSGKRLHWFEADELQAWSHGQSLFSVGMALPLPASTCGSLERAAGVFGESLDSLGTKALDRLSRAADHYQFVRYHTRERAHDDVLPVPDLHPSETAFRWTVAMEGLLAPEGGSEFTRKVSQRAAVLVGRDDDERLAVEQTVKSGYAARSAYAHGGKDRNADLSLLGATTRRVITAWMALAAVHGRDTERVLDNALLSSATLREGVHEPLTRFRVTSSADGWL